MSELMFSVVVAVYNRPRDVDALLASLAQQTYRNFEVILVEDASTDPCKEVSEKYESLLRVRYYFNKENKGPSYTRNYGMERAQGRYYVFFDSDCRIPSSYFDCVIQRLKSESFDVWGGPERAHKDFSFIQRAISATMTSFLLTGGTRGSDHVQVDTYRPRSLNMGIHKEVFKSIGGFHEPIVIGEDIIFGIRIKKEGFKTIYIHEAYVYHKRTESWRTFFWRVAVFGKVRVQIGRRYPEEERWLYYIPMGFVLMLLIFPILAYVFPLLAYFIGIGGIIFFVTIAVETYRKQSSIPVALLSIVAAGIQLVGYGLGFGIEKLFGRYKIE